MSLILVSFDAPIRAQVTHVAQLNQLLVESSQRPMRFLLLLAGVSARMLRKFPDPADRVSLASSQSWRIPPGGRVALPL